MTAHIDTPSGTAAGSIELIDHALISPNPQNPRKYFDEAALQELADSMKPVGHNTVPVLVRPVSHWYCKPWRESRADGFAEVWRVTDRRIPETDANAGLLLKAPAFDTLEEAERNLPRYELVYGERRWRACVLAGYSVLAMVREMSDQECIDSLTTDATADERFCFAAALLLAGSYRGAKFLKEKHQIECDLPELYRSLQRLPTHDVVEVLMVDACMQAPGDWAGWELTEERIPGALGVDVKAVTKQAKKDYGTGKEAPKPAKKAKAKKPKPQPKED